MVRSRWLIVGVILALAVPMVAMPTDRDGQAEASEAGAPQHSAYDVAGLRQPAEIIVDRSGIPHIYAKSTDDAFLAQGFNVARDRLFQIDLWRRRGLGQLSEVFGSSFVEQDRATRLFLYRGDMDAEWAAYDEDARDVATRFTSGINAYVEWLTEHPEALPKEFQKLDYKPARWSPEDVVRIRSHGLTANLTDEVNRAKAFCAGGVQADRVRKKLEPEHATEVPEGLDPCLPDDLLDVYTLATQDVSFTGDPDQPLKISSGPIARKGRDPANYGSNNWTISGDRTTTGRPILANDPHRSVATPSLRYITHLAAPDMNVIGAGEPALPGLSIGHNGSIAFGLTIFAIDAQDLYVYDLDPNDPSRYRYGNGWKSFETEREQIAVRGEDSRDVELSFSKHGPVIHVDEEANRAYAVRTVWSEPGTSAYFGSIGYMRAKNWPEFLEAMRRWGTPGENQVYADVEGNIGWKPGGVVPNRVNWDGLLPVPGDGRFEWDGLHDSDYLPVSFNPTEGYFATANQFNIPDDFPKDRQIAYEWSDPSRFNRITEVLSGLDKVSMEDTKRLQNDVTSVSARDLVGVLTDIDPGESDPDVSAALSVLDGWDAVESADSAAAALYEVWLTRHLRPALVEALLPEDAAKGVSAADTVVVGEALAHPQRWFDDDPDVATSKRDELVRATLGQAYAETRSLLGDNAAAWQWGDLHQSTQKHPLHALDPSLSVGPMPTGGSSSTPGAASYETGSFAHTSGASFRMVLDVGDWDNSVTINTPGQSGEQSSPHYDDLAEKWRTGEYVPLHYSRAAVERHAEHRIRLRPA